MTGRIDQPGEAFWRFSLALYARPGVAAALITLQDRVELDVNVILFTLWLGSCCGRQVEATEIAAAEKTIAALRADIITPLRQLRRKLKQAAEPDIQGLRRRIASLEIDSERRVQHRLAAEYAASPAIPAPDRLAAAEANLVLYLGAEANSTEAATLRTALAALMRKRRFEAVESDAKPSSFR